MVARQAHNLKVVGSNPAPATTWSCSVVINMPLCHRGDREFDSRQDRHGFVAQSVEHRTENASVGSSILPETTTIKLQ